MYYLIQLYDNTICSEKWKVDGSFNYYRFYYIQDGEACYTDSNKSLILNVNSLYIFPTNEYYTITHNPMNPLNVLWFHVAIFSPLKIDITEIEIKNNDYFYHLLNCLIYSTRTTRVDVDKLFSVLFDNIISRNGIYSIDKKEIIHIMNYINQNYFEKISNKKLAYMIGYSEKYFIRLFSSIVGMQPHKYILKVRLSHAAKLLIEGKSVKEVANLAGYGNVNNFSRDFKLNYLLSPKEYFQKYTKMP